MNVRRNVMTALLTIGGFVLVISQMVRMRIRPRGWRRMTNALNRMMEPMFRGVRMGPGGVLQVMRRR